MATNIQKKLISGLSKDFGDNGKISFESFFEIALGMMEKWFPGKEKGDGLIDVIDFFSGCGGMSLGFDAISKNYKVFNLLGGIDINPVALKSYENNFYTKTLQKDIREIVENEEVPFIKNYFGIENRKNPLVVIGCAPCQGFTAHRKKRWHLEDDRNTLVGHFADIAVQLDPDFIIMENVPEILGTKYWNHYQEARSVFHENGYYVQQTIYNSASFGVPQSRSRAIVIASKTKAKMPIPVFSPDEYKTVREAISDLPEISAGAIIDSDPFHRSARHKKSTIETIKCVPKNGGNRPSGVGPQCLDKVKGFYDVYGRLHWDKPSITLTQYSRNPASGRFTHPEQNRGLTIREAARLQSFPDSYVFSGSLDQCFKQIGESVPPNLSLAIASMVVLHFSGTLKENGQEVISVNEPVTSSYFCELKSNQKFELSNEANLY